MALAIVKNHFVEYRDLFREMLFHTQAKVSTPIVVARQISRNCKYPPGLLFQARSDQCRLSQGAPVRMRQTVNICRDPIEKLQITVLVEYAAKRFLDEMWAFTAHR